MIYVLYKYHIYCIYTQDNFNKDTQNDTMFEAVSIHFPAGPSHLV